MSTPQPPDPSAPKRPTSGSTSVGAGEPTPRRTAEPASQSRTSPEPAGPADPGHTTTPEASTTTGDDPLRGSRTSFTWLGVVVAVILLVLLIIFIAQNTDDSPVKFLGWKGEAPVAVLLLAAAVVGMAVTAVFGSMRIIQLRRRVKRER